MRVVLLTCVYPPEPVTSASTSESLASGLAERGHGVTVITGFPSRPGGRTFSGYRRRFVQTKTEGSIRVVRCFSTQSRKATLLSRFWENLSFGVVAGVMLALARRPDAVYLNTWPIFASSIAAAVARLRRIPVVLSVQDVYPESLISLNKLSAGSRVARVLRSVDAWIARSAAAVIVISRRVEDIYSRARKVAPERLWQIANWRAVENAPPAEAGLALRSNWGVPDGSFVALFAGNVAAACGIEAIVKTASRLQAETDLEFIVAGAGCALENCRAIAAQDGNNRIRFCGSFPARDTMSILSAADVLILPTHGDQSLVSMPSKLISYMMAARPIVAIARHESDLAAVIREAGCGWVAEPGDEEKLLSLLRLVTSLDRSTLARMGEMGRRHALAHFSTEVCLPRLIKVLESLEGK